MTLSAKVLFLLSLTTVLQAQDPRKRILISPALVDLSDDYDFFESKPMACSIHGCVKRATAEVGPFWANRGKKDPKYVSNRLYAQEPSWVYVTDDNTGYNEPFFVTRGKKNLEGLKKHPWLLKDLTQDKRSEVAPDSPFFAARGKKTTNVF